MDDSTLRKAGGRSCSFVFVIARKAEDADDVSLRNKPTNGPSRVCNSRILSKPNLP